MFGYIKPFKPELRLKEFDTYKAVYCGLCHRMGRGYGLIARFTLSYDFAFAGLLGMALEESFAGFENARCIAHPFRKRPCAVCCQSLTFVSACAMTMLHQKVRDDIADSSFFRSIPYRLLKPFSSRMNRRAAEQYPALTSIFEEMMTRQFSLEKEKQVSIDAAAEPTSSAMSQMMEMLSEDPLQKRVLSRFGYLLGRWVYFIDALDDLRSDAREHSFNPFLIRFDPEEKYRGRTEIPESLMEEMLSYGQGVLNLTVGELASTYELLTLNRYKTILDNIIYLGLSSSMKNVLQQNSTEKKKRSV